MNEELMVGEKRVGIIQTEEFKVYETHRNFFSHQYNYNQAYYWEKELIKVLENRGVVFIRVVEHHKNKRNNIEETKTFIFPLVLLKNSELEPIYYRAQGYGKQIGITRETILKFEVSNG